MRVVVVAAVCLCGCSDKGDITKDTTLVIPGSGAPANVTRAFAAAFTDTHPGYEVSVPPSVGTRGGYRSVGIGEAVLARVARPPKGEEVEYELTYVPFARDAVVFAVGSESGVSSLTPAQLADIFSGKIVNWREVGGSNKPIRVLVRQPGETSLSVIQKHMPEFAGLNFPTSAKCLCHDYEMTRLLAKHPTSIGFLTKGNLVPLGPTVRAIAVDGINPTVENVKAGRYNMSTEYAFAYEERRLNSLAREFLDFVFSPAGHEIVVSNGMSALHRGGPR